jgi:phosphopantothenoylcysteine decarboxylase/phosphopantothenate--cysteine ligase
VHFLVSAGPTREYFDSVRFISNPSSGKMGYAIAYEAARRGHKVTLVSGPVSLAPPKKVEIVSVVSAAEMAKACKGAFVGADVAVMTAAVCDYRPKQRAGHKIEKKARTKRVVLEPTEDIATSLGRRKGGQILVGFAMEDHDPYRHAERKLTRKRCDLMVLNGPENVGSDRAVVELFTLAEGWSEPIKGSKRAVARRLIKVIESMHTSK